MTLPGGFQELLKFALSGHPVTSWVGMFFTESQKLARPYGAEYTDPFAKRKSILMRICSKIAEI